MESITLNFWQFIAAFIAAMGIPSAVMGLIIWRLERKIAKRESHAKAQEDLFLLLIQSTAAAIALGEATAKAVQRIPDAHCNGDMHAALNYAAEIKHKQKDFLAAQGIHALHQDGK